jgi:hypothetical protein
MSDAFAEQGAASNTDASARFPAQFPALPWESFDELHRRKVDAVAFLHRVDGDDVRMIALREGLRFATKAS